MDTNRIAAVVFAVLMITSVVAVPWTAAAQEDPERTGPPASYYGDVTIDSEPAPAGTTVEAVIDGEVVGSITTNESGEYGGPGRFEDKLLVGQNESIESGSEVRFFVNNDEIERTEVGTTDPETVEFDREDVQRVDLSVAIEEPLFRLDITDTPANVSAGDNIPVEFNVTNAGVEAGENRTITVSVDGEVRETFVETLAVNETRQLAADVSTNADDVGNATVTVDTGDQTESVTTVVNPATLSVTDLTVGDSGVATNESVPISVTLNNPSDTESTETLEVSAGGSALDSTQVDVPAGGTRTAELSPTFARTGERTLRITGDQVDPQTRDVSVVSPAVRTFDVAPTSTVVGEQIEVVAEVENNRRSEATVPVTVTGTPSGTSTASVTVAGESTNDITFVFAYDTAGSRDLNLTRADDTQTVDVTAPAVPLVVTPDPAAAAPGEEITFTVTRVDTGEEVDDVELDFTRPESSPERGSPVTGTANVTSGFTTSFEAPGEYSVTVSDARSEDRDTVNFTSGSAEFRVLPPANLSLVEAETPVPAVPAGTPVPALVTVENDGEVPATQTLRLVAGTGDSPDVLATRNVTVGPGEPRQVDIAGPLQPSGSSLPDDRTLVVQRFNGTVQESATAGNVTALSPLPVVDVSLQSEVVDADNDVRVNVTVANVSQSSLGLGLGSQAVTVTVGDTPTSKDFNPNAGAEQTQTYALSPPGDGAEVNVTIAPEFGENRTRTVEIEEGVQDIGLTANRTPVEPGEPIQFTLSTNDQDFDADIEVVDTRSGDVEEEAAAVTTDGGTATISIDEPGVYQVRTADHDTDAPVDPGRTMVRVLEPGDVRVIDAAVTTPEVVRTETVNVTVTLVNPGETTASENVTIVGQDTPSATQNVSVDPGNLTTVTLATNFTTEGPESIAVETEDTTAAVPAGTVEVTPALVVENVQVSPRPVTVGDTVSVDVDVRNRAPDPVDDETIDRTLTLGIDGVEENETSAFSGDGTYDAGETKTITFTPDVLNPVQDPGVRQVTVDESNPRTIAVSRQSVDLSLDISDQQTVGEPVTFDVNASGEPVDATLRLPGRAPIDVEGGTATETFNASIRSDIVVTKSANDTTRFVPDFEELSVSEPADVVVTRAETNVTEAFAGQQVGVSLTVRNVGGDAGSGTVNITEINGDSTLKTATIETLSPGETRTLDVAVQLNDTGVRTLEAGGLVAGTTIVDDAVAVTDTDIPSAATADESFDVNVTVADRVAGGETESVNLTVTAGDESEERSVPINDNSTTERFEFSFNDSVTAQVETDDRIVATDRIAVSQRTVGLSLAVNESEIVAGDSVSFTVTDDNGNPVGATVEVAGRSVSTDSGTGEVTTAIPTIGNFTAVTTKDGTPARAFTSASTQVNVTDPLAVSVANNFTTASVGPEQGTNREAATQSRDVVINNTGGLPIQLGGIGFLGADADQYRIISNIPQSVDSNSETTVSVEFEPTVRGDTDAQFRLRAGTPRNPIRTVPLNGTGTGPDVEVNRTNVGFGTEIASDDPKQNQTINVSNDGNRPLSVDPGSLGAGFTVSPDSETVIDPGESQEFTASFDPSGRSPNNFSDILQLETNDTFDGTVNLGLTATISEGELRVSPTSLDAGEIAVDGTATFDVVVSNTGTETIETINATNETTANGLSVVAVGPGDIESTVEGLGPGSQELVAVQLTQTADAETSSANVTFVPDADAVDNRTITIDATPIAPTLSTNPGIDNDPTSDEVALGEVATGSTATDTFEITNDGNATLELTNVRIDGPTGTPFGLATESDTLSIQPGETQSLTVQFTPQNADTFDESDLAFDFNNASVDGTTSVTADLTGQGIETTLGGDNSSVQFGPIGSSSAATDSIEIENEGNAELTINSIAVRGPDDGQFAADPDGSVAGDTLGAGDTATVPLQYDPTEAAAHVAEVSVIASSPDGLSEFTATLRGEAIPPEAAVDDRSIGFGFVNAELDETASGSVEVENVGDDATTLNVTSLSVAGDDAFSVTSESSFRLGGDESRPVTVEFDPDSGDSGTITGTLTIETDDPDATAIDVSLEAEATAPDATTNRTSIDFGQVPTGTQSGIRTVGITNDGGAAATVTDVALNDTSEFTIVSGFEGTVVPGETVPVTVRTAPADAGSTDTNLTVTTASGSDTVDPVQLRTDGAVPELTVRNGIDPDFGEIGSSSSTAQTLSIENTGNATLRADISASGEAFSVPESQQTLRVSPGGTADIRVTFSPPDTGDFDGTVAIDTNDGSTTEFPTSGSGGEANASVSPSTVDFGRVALDTETTETVTLENIGVDQLNITQTTIEGRDVSAFGVADLDASTLESDESTTFNVTVEPTIARGLSGQVTIGTGDTSDVTISLSATGTEPEIGVAASSVSFDRTRLEATSTETIDIRNTGNNPLNVSSVRVSGVDAGQFAVDSDAAVIAPGGSRTVAVEFTPNNNETAARQGTVQSATVTIRSNDTDEAVTTVELSGQSKTPDLQLPALQRFGTLQVGQTTTRSLEVTNDPTATASISLDSFSIIGSDANEFSIDPPNDRSLNPGESAEINVSVTPESGGIKTASLLVETNDPRQSVESVSLSNSRTVAVVEYGSVTFDYNGVAGTDPKFKSSNDPSTGVIGIDPRLNSVTDFELQLSTRSAAAGPELGDSSDVAATPIRYLGIDNTDITASEHDETTVQFHVSKATISNLGSTEDGITLYQYDGSQYDDLSTTRIPGDDTATEFAYQATFDSFNDLVIAAGQPDLGLTSASASGAPDTLESGQTTTVTVSADVENTGSIAGSDTVRVNDSSGNTLNSTTVNVGTGGTPTVPVDVDLTGPGSRTLTVAFGGQTQDVTVDIDSPDDGGPPAGGGDDDDAPADEPTDVPAPVEEIGAEPETVESVAPTVNAETGQAVAEFETADNVRTVALDTTQEVEDVTVSEVDPDTVESNTEPVPGDAAATQDISVPDEAEDTSATIGFEVSPDQVSGDAENLRAFRLVDDDWQALDTEVVEATDDSIVLEAETPGFSLFAVSEVQPPEASLSLDSTPAQVGDEVTLSGADSADPDGEIEAYEWTVDGETLTGETVTVTLDEPGEYTVELAVTDDAGETDTVTETLVIEAADTETATPAPETPEPDVQSPTEAPPEEPGGFDTLPAVVVIVVLALGVGYIAYRRREQ